MFTHLHESRELTEISWVHSPYSVLLDTCSPWVRDQWVFLMTWRCCARRQWRKVEISDRSMEQFCHLLPSVCPVTHCYHFSIRQFVGLFRLFLTYEEMKCEVQHLLVGHLPVKKLFCFLIPRLKHFSATTQKTFARLLLSLVMPLTFG